MLHPWSDTPRRLVSAGALAAVLLAASTAFLSYVIYFRSADTRDARDRAGASVVEAQQVRAALSRADASAAALVFAHVELDLGDPDNSAAAQRRNPDESRKTYATAKTRDDVDESLAEAMRGVLKLRRLHPAPCPESVSEPASAPESRSEPPAGPACAGSLLDSLGRTIPQYAHLVSAARANTRVGREVGETYLRVASDMMRTQIIPVTDELVALGAEEFDRTFQRATSGTRELGVAVTLGLSGLLLLLLQVLLFRHSNRVFDVRLLAGSACLAATAGLATLALSMQQSRLDDARDTGYNPMTMLAQSTVFARQAHADENLVLTSLGSEQEYKTGFSRAVKALGYDVLGRRLTAYSLPDGRPGSLVTALELFPAGEVPSDLKDDMQKWLAVRSQVIDLLGTPVDSAGDQDPFIEATLLTVGPDADAFERFDRQLSMLVDKSRDRFELGMSASLSPLYAFGVPAAAGLAVGTFLSLLGILRRFNEYRP